MGTPEGLQAFGEAYDRRRGTDAAFLARAGWQSAGEEWSKGGRVLRHSEAVAAEVDDLKDTAGWRTVGVDMSVLGTTESWAFYVSPATGRVYQWLEVGALFYHGLPEDAIFPSQCSGITLDLNRLFPGPKPDVMRVEFVRVGDGHEYRRLD